MNVDEKLAWLFQIEENEIINEATKQQLVNLVNDRSTLVRGFALKRLQDYPTNEIKEVLFNHANDKNHLVRSDVAESLGFFPFEGTILLLKQMSKDKNYLVRGYAFDSLYEVASKVDCDLNKVIDFIKDGMKKERNKFVLLNCCYALYRFGLTEYFDQIISFLDAKKVNDRCATVNVLIHMAEKENYQLLKKEILKRYENEETIAVKSTMDEFLELEKELN